MSSSAAITGIGQTAFSKASGRSVLSLCSEASINAIRDAGLEPGDIDGLVSFTVDNNDEFALQKSIGLKEMRWTSRSPFGGAGAYATFQHAIAAIESGMASHVLIYRAFNERSESRYGQPGWSAGANRAGSRHLHRSFGLTTPAQAYGLWYRPYMDQYGISSEDLGRYVVQARAYAATNPRAWFYQRPLTLEEHQQSRWIVEPVLRLLDCCQETDGGAAFVVSSVKTARGMNKPVVRLLAAKQLWLQGSEALFNFYVDDLVAQQDTENLARELWQDSGLTPKDVDVMTIYENFSPIVHMCLEGFGFCKSGEARDLINSGGIGLNGEIPVNTHGGLLGEAYLHGLNNVLEVVRQLRGIAPNQITDAKTGLVAFRHCGLLLQRE